MIEADRILAFCRDNKYTEIDSATVACYVLRTSLPIVSLAFASLVRDGLAKYKDEKETVIEILQEKKQ